MPNNKPDLSQFGSAKPAQTGDPRQCAQCEAMLIDALDGTLTPADQAAFDLHLVGCPACSAMTADAQRGAAWLELLKTPRPEPPTALLDRILAQTSGVQTSGAHTSGVQTSSSATNTTSAAEPSPIPSNSLLGRPMLLPQVAAAAAVSPSNSNVLPFRSRLAAGFNLRSIGQTLLQPRLAMTAAMAFFSVALTLNLTGVRLSELRASDLRPSSIKRSFSEANAHVVRYYDNLRVVYELESRVHDLQHSGDSSADLPAADPKAQPAQQPSGTQQPSQAPGQKNSNPDSDQPKPRPRPGTSRRENIGPNLQFVAAASANPDPSPVQQALATPLPRVDLPRLKSDSAVQAVQEGTLV